MNQINDFEEMMSQALFKRRDIMKNEYNRVLPTGELLFNRFDKAEYLKFGKNSSVYDTSVIMGDIDVGENVWIGPYTLIEGINGKVKIGNYVSINAGVMIFSHDSSKHYLSGGIDEFEKGDVSIGDKSVIGSMSIIKHGVCIGSHCLVAANTFVVSDIPDNKIVAGTPGKVIGDVIINKDGHVEYKYSKE